MNPSSCSLPGGTHQVHNGGELAAQAGKSQIQQSSLLCLLRTHRVVGGGK